MTEQKAVENMIDNMIGMARSSIETGRKNMQAFQQQAETIFSVSMNNLSRFQEETQKGLNTLMQNTYKARDMYFDAVDKSLENLSNGRGKKKSDDR